MKQSFIDRKNRQLGLCYLREKKQRKPSVSLAFYLEGNCELWNMNGIPNKIYLSLSYGDTSQNCEAAGSCGETEAAGSCGVVGWSCGGEDATRKKKKKKKTFKNLSKDPLTHC